MNYENDAWQEQQQQQYSREIAHTVEALRIDSGIMVSERLVQRKTTLTVHCRKGHKQVQ